MTNRQVTIKTVTVGQCFATCAIILDAKSKKRLAETRDYPYGFQGPALDAAVALAETNGWVVVDNRA